MCYVLSKPHKISQWVKITITLDIIIMIIRYICTYVLMYKEAFLDLYIIFTYTVIMLYIKYDIIKSVTKTIFISI